MTQREKRPDGAVTVDHVVRQFGDVVAVDNVSLNIAAGEFVTLLGPSGCGKTTLLRMIAGFEQPDAGTIHLGERDITQLPPEDRPLNMVFQRYALFPHLNVAENIAYGLRNKGKDTKEIVERVRLALTLVDLPGLGDREIRQISGGQQQRVALARALVNEPSVLLLDEPLSALDLQLRKRMQIELRSLQHRLGTTFVFVTHDQEEALTMSDRIVVISNGRVEQIGSPQVVYQRPASYFVASFVGEGVLLRAELERGDRGPLLRVDQATGAVRLEAPPAGLEKTGKGWIVVRPEQWCTRPPSERSLEFRGTVNDRMFLGGAVHNLVMLSNGTEAKVETSPSKRLDDGNLELYVDADAVAFVPEEGKRDG